VGQVRHCERESKEGAGGQVPPFPDPLIIHPPTLPTHPGAASAGSARPPPAPAPTSPLAEWKDGASLPEGFDAMPPLQKAYNLWAGRRGALYWASQSAWYSAIGLGGGWILFRFVLPALGVYKLANGLTDAPL